jgi:hypothetical protein
MAMANYNIPQYPTKRLRYFNNQFLNDQDFIDDDAAQIGHERAVLRSLCVAGVCEGLVVTYPASNKPPSVSAGIAIDKAGCLIVIDQPTDGLANPSALADGDYFVHISFLESADNKATGQGAADYTRWKQTPAINATAKVAALPDGVVVLGSCTVKAGAFVGSGTTVGRQYSGLRLPGPNTGAAATLRNTDASDNLAMLTGSLMVRRDVAGQQGPTLTLQNPAGGAGAGGAIDFNGYDPGTNDPSARVRSLDDGNFSSHLTFSTKLAGANTNKLVERLRITNTGNVGIGAQAPSDILHVRNAGTVGLFESSTTQATLRLATSEGTANQVMLANRSGGNAAISVGTAGDALIVNKNGGVVVSKASGGVGDLTVENYLRFPNAAPKDKIVIWDSGSTDRFGIGLNSSNINLFCPTNASFSLRQNSTTGTEFFSVKATGAATFFGPIVPKVGNDTSSGIQFPSNPGGGTGDEAFLRYYVTTGETTKLMLGINNEPSDTLGLWQAGAERLTVSAGNVGIGTQAPSDILHVRNADTVGLFESSTTQAALRLATSEGMANHVELANRPGGNAAISVGTAGDALLVNKDGRVVVSKASGGIGDLTVENYLRFPNESYKDKILIFEDGATNRYGIGLGGANINLFCPASANFSLRQNSANGTEVFTIDAAKGNAWTAGSMTFQQRGGTRSVSMYCEPGSTAFVIYPPAGNGVYFSPGSGWSVNSDASLKEDIVIHEPVLDRVMQLRPVRYRWKLDGTAGSGFIAQEVEALFPDLVSEGSIDESIGRRLKGLVYDRVGVLAVAAIKELKMDYDARLDALERKLVAQGGKS